MRLPWSTTSSLVLGTFCFGLRTLRLPVSQARVHTHVLGKTGSGKSYFLANLFLSMQRAGLAATLLDPHGDLAELILTHVLSSGLRTGPGTRHRLIYLDLPASECEGRSTPRLDYDEGQVYVNQAWKSVYGLQVVLRDAASVLPEGRVKSAIQGGIEDGQTFLLALSSGGGYEEDARRLAETQMLGALRTLRWKYRSMNDQLKQELQQMK